MKVLFVCLSNILFRLFKKIWKVTCRVEKENLDIMMTGMLDTLDLFEKDSLNSYILKKSHDENSKMETKIGVMEEKMNKEEIRRHVQCGPDPLVEYENPRTSVCAMCRQPISGRCITAMFRKFHPECFVCR